MNHDTIGEGGEGERGGRGGEGGREGGREGEEGIHVNIAMDYRSLPLVHESVQV